MRTRTHRDVCACVRVRVSFLRFLGGSHTHTHKSEECVGERERRRSWRRAAVEEMGKGRLSVCADARALPRLPPPPDCASRRSSALSWAARVCSGVSILGDRGMAHTMRGASWKSRFLRPRAPPSLSRSLAVPLIVLLVHIRSRASFFIASANNNNGIGVSLFLFAFLDMQRMCLSGCVGRVGEGAVFCPALSHSPPSLSSRFLSLCLCAATAAMTVTAVVTTGQPRTPHPLKTPPPPALCTAASLCISNPAIH